MNVTDWLPTFPYHIIPVALAGAAVLVAVLEVIG